MELISKQIWNNTQEEQLVNALNKAALVTVTDSEGVIIYSNDGFCKISGYSEQELLGNTHSMLKSGMQPDSLFSDMWALISSNKIWTGKICNKKKDGSYYWADTTIIPFEDAFGNIEKYISIRYDISKWVENKSNLKLTQDKFKIIFEGTPHPYIITDLQGKILECNIATATLFGYKKKELVNMLIWDLNVLNETDRAFLSSRMKISSPKPFRTEFLVTSKNGKKIDIEIVSHHLVIDSEPVVLTMVHDITNNKTILKKLQEKTSDLELLLYRSGHDLRTPFTSLEGLLNLLKMESLNESSLDIVNMFESVLTDGKRLIDNLSTSSLMLNKSITKDDIDFNQLVSKTISSLSHIDEFNNVSFNVNISEGFKINSNLQLISSMLQNIIQNAIKHKRPFNATHTPFIIISAFKTNTGYKICIKDNGIGINKNELDKVFKLYYRSHNNVDGTGLGLYITKNIVEQLNGTITVQSIENEMTQFDINLPNTI
jgi:PAS domain S-box-containing protein